MMAIEVRIPKEITEYQEKILFGLTIRQLICFASAIVLGVGTYWLVSKYFGTEVASYVVIFEVMPIFALGFFKKDGFNFESYVSLILRHQLGTNKRGYKTELDVERFEKEVQHVQYAQKKKKTRRSEADGISFTRTKENRKAKSKAIARKIKAARKEYKSVRSKFEKGIKEEKSSKNNAANY